ncbi:hypothetical protein CLOL250_00599 [Clostridium sp. L2-50]|nr:hypothetical protein CLOL250_00599 [Clostridium sp. L2-50]
MEKRLLNSRMKYLAKAEKISARKSFFILTKMDVSNIIYFVV